MTISSKGAFDHPVVREFLEALGRNAVPFSVAGQISLFDGDTLQVPSKKSPQVSASSRATRFFGRKCEITSI